MFWIRNPPDSQFQWGVPLDSLLDPGLVLQPVPEDLATIPTKSFSIKDRLLPYLKPSDKGYGTSLEKLSHQELMQIASNLPLEPYFNDFTYEELLKFMFGGAVETAVHRAFKRRFEFPEDFEIQMPEVMEYSYKLMNSIYQLGPLHASWNKFAAAFNAIPSLNLGSQFELRFDHTRVPLRIGWAQHVEHQVRSRVSSPDYSSYFAENMLYLDGIFAYLVYLEGKHVLTIGFSVGEGRILINQIQPRRPKGNRWIYQLNRDLFSYILDRMYQHFSAYGLELCLISANSLAKIIQYEHDGKLDPQILARVVQNYSRPLDGYRRAQEVQVDIWLYYVIRPD